MRRYLALIAAVALAACSGGRTASEPIYELRATEEPLRYGLESTQLTVIEIPTGGEQEVEASTSAVLSLAYGSSSDDALPFVLTFEELDVSVAGLPESPDVSSILGEPVRGTIGPDGEISVDEAPELELPGMDAGGLAEMIAPLAVPLPPEGDPSAESWPLTRSRPVTGDMSGRTELEATVRFAPETEWEGRQVRIIVAEGDLRQRISGQPEGSAEEVDIDLRGETTSRYVWDQMRGVVLHVEQNVDMEGSIGMQTMALPMTSSATQTYELLP